MKTEKTIVVCDGLDIIIKCDNNFAGDALNLIVKYLDSSMKTYLWNRWQDEYDRLEDSDAYTTVIYELKQIEKKTDHILTNYTDLENVENRWDELQYERRMYREERERLESKKKEFWNDVQNYRKSIESDPKS